jgi:phosphoribosylamine--glycine ligase
MISPNGDFKVLEFNCRFGDPETQVILPLLATPLEELILACVEQRLGELPPIAWQGGASATVVAASGGYPGDYEKGKVITGIPRNSVSCRHKIKPATTNSHRRRPSPQRNRNRRKF